MHALRSHLLHGRANYRAQLSFFRALHLLWPGKSSALQNWEAMRILNPAEELRSASPELTLPPEFAGGCFSRHIAAFLNVSDAEWSYYTALRPLSPVFSSYTKLHELPGQVDLLRLDALQHAVSCQLLRNLLRAGVPA